MFTPSPISLKRIRYLLLRHLNSIKEDGVQSMPDVTKDIISKIKRLIFSIEKYYLYQYSFVNLANIPSFQPKVDNISMCTLFSEMSMEEFETIAETGYDFRNDPRVNEYRDDKKGLVIFCGLAGNELAYQACVATYRTGVYKYVCSSEYDLEKVAYQGLNVTSREFRRRGLYTWGQCEMLKFFRDHDYNKMLMLEAESLEDMRRIQDRIGSQVLYESYCLRVLFFLSYRWNIINSR